MENRPNNEISELLARLQEKVAKKSEPKVDSVKSTGEESPQELLDLLKKNLGAKEQSEVSFDNREYSIEGYEFEEDEATAFDTELCEDGKDSSTIEIENEQDQHTREEEEILHSRVEMLVTESVSYDEEWNLPQMSEKIAEPVPTVSSDASAELCEASPDLMDEETLRNEEVVITEEPLIREENAAPEASLLQEISDLDDERSSGEENTLSDAVEQTVLPDLQDTAISEEDVAFTVQNDVDEKEITSSSTEDVLEDDGEVILLDVTPDVDAQEEELEDEYAEVYLSEPAVKRFFRFRRLKAESDDNRHKSMEAPDFDHIDINLAVALGSKDELENSIGYTRVRSAKNGFYDPFLEESTGENTYGYSGEEFRNDGQTDSIKKRYVTENTKIAQRFFATFVLSIIILFVENLPMTAIKIPYLSSFLSIPECYYTISLLLSLLLNFISLKRILSGLHSFLFLQGAPFVPVACLAFLNFIYNLIVLFFFRENGLPVYNFVMSVFLLFCIADEAMRLNRESLAFEVVSNRKPKLSLEKLEGNVQTEASDAFSFKQDFFVEKVNFVGNFFTRSGRRSIQFTEYFYELAFSALGALAVALLSAYLTKDISVALTAFVFAMFICVPMQFLTVNIYPFFHLTKGLSKLDSAVIGDAVTEEYSDADTIYLEDSEMFGKYGARVVGVRVYNDMDFYALLSYALSIFTVLGAPLCNVFDNSAKEIEKKDNVKITNIAVGGVEAIVDLNRVHVGNLAFMRSHGYFPKRNPDDEKKIEDGQVSILYMAIGGDLCAKLYIQYTVTQRFEKFAAEMLKNGIHVGIRTLDPSVNEKMIAILRNDKDVSIKVIRPTPNELIPIGKHSDSGIVTSKNSHMVFKILAQCFNIKRIHAQQRRFRLIAILVGVLISMLVAIGRFYTDISSLYIVIYQVLWLLPPLIYTKSNLK